MRIAQIAPLVESVPPTLYGGTERVVSWLTEELVAMGHDVTLFASGDSVTSAKLEPVTPRALRLAGVHDCTPYNIIMLDKVAARQVPVTLDYAGFVAPDVWLVGYGMDSDGLGRNLPDIHAVSAAE